MALDLKQHVGIRVRAARLERQLTQERLAEKIDKTGESISNIERGQVLPPLDTLHRISEVLRVPLVSLLEGIGTSADPERAEMEARLSVTAAGLSTDQLRLAVKILALLRSTGD